MAELRKSLTPLSEKIGEMDAKLAELGQEIEDIGMPAAYDLKRRYDALLIESRALHRNFEESVARGEPDAVRLEKMETLLHHIQQEEALVEQDAHFLHQSNPSTVILAAEIATRMLELWRKALHKVIGDSRPLGESAFVNHSSGTLSDDKRKPDIH